MKKYINANNEFAPKILKINGVQIINPSEQQLIEAGYYEYIEPIHVPTLEDIKDEKIAELLEYDSSSAVNSFTYNGQALWYDKTKRGEIRQGLESEKRMGREMSTLIDDSTGIIISESPDNLIRMMDMIECYAKDAYLITVQHVLAIKALTTEEEVNNYNYEVGYPVKIAF
jgi:hypothetical protein